RQRTVDGLALGVVREQLGPRQVEDLQAVVEALQGLDRPGPLDFQPGVGGAVVGGDVPAELRDVDVLGPVYGVERGTGQHEQDEQGELDKKPAHKIYTCAKPTRCHGWAWDCLDHGPSPWFSPRGRRGLRSGSPSIGGGSGRSRSGSTRNRCRRPPTLSVSTITLSRPRRAATSASHARRKSVRYACRTTASCRRRW